MLQNLEKWLPKIKRKKILVVGDVGVDRYTIGAVERISPEAPVPIVRVEEEILKLGLAANVADNIQALGGQARMVGVIGADRAASDLRGLFDRAKIPFNDLISERGYRTILKERIVSDSQQLLRVDFESKVPIRPSTRHKLRDRVRALVQKVDAVIVEDYAKGLLDFEIMQTAIEAGKEAKVCVTVDPNARTPLEWYAGADLLTPNTREAEALVGFSIRDPKALRQAGKRLLSATGAQNVIITRGREGMALFSSGDNRVWIIPTYAQEVFDVSGAGDTVIAVITLMLSAGADLIEAALVANLAAGVEVGKRGTATVSPSELKNAIRTIKARALKGPSILR